MRSRTSFCNGPLLRKNLARFAPLWLLYTLALLLGMALMYSENDSFFWFASNMGELIPLGSLILPELLSGRGPAIPVRILSIRNSESTFESYFTEAGINQTLHQLTMQVGVDVAILVLGRSESFTVTSQVVVAETIIVGDVPDTFLQAGG